MLTGYTKCFNSSQMIPTEQFCDGYYPPHCKDGSDQRYCTMEHCLFPNMWPCVHGDECISREFVCNGYPNCDNESDEDIEVCDIWKCGIDEINVYGTDI